MVTRGPFETRIVTVEPAGASLDAPGELEMTSPWGTVPENAVLVDTDPARLLQRLSEAAARATAPDDYSRI